MSGKGGDYEGWILRLIDKAEDIRHSYNMIEWLKFAAEKIEEASGQGITKGQIASLEEYRGLAFELPMELGFKLIEKTRYRDDRGRWSKDVTDRPTKIMVYRGEGEKFISKSKADMLVKSEIGSRGVRVENGGK